MDMQMIPVASPNGNAAALPSDSPYSIRRRSFPADFVFGASSSSYQYEGAANIDGRSPSIWDVLTTQHPDRILDKSNGTIANDSYHRYKEDVALLKKMGLSAYRFSLSWPRILPTGKPSGGVNREGVDYYNNLIDELLANGIEPWVTLFHWDLPQVLQDEYSTAAHDPGFLSRQFVDDFREFARVCFWEFGDRVKNWITINEPQMFCSGVFGLFVPSTTVTVDRTTGKKVTTISRLGRFSVVDPTTFSDASEARQLPRGGTLGDPSTEPYLMAHFLLLAHSAAVRLYRQRFKAGQKGKIGITLNTDWFLPLSETSISDQKAAVRAQDFTLGWFMDPLTTGQYPASMQTNVGSRLPVFSHHESEQLIGTYDFIGLNYYTSNYATDLPKTPGQPVNYDTDCQVKFETERDGVPIGEKVGTTTWVYNCPQGLYHLLKYMKSRYSNPLVYITENGVDQETHLILTVSCADKFREKYIKDHLAAVLKAIDEEANVKGHMTWSLMDDFEWVSGYTSHFGYFNVDYRNGLARFPRDSAIWYMNFLTEDTKDNPRKRALTFDESKRSRKKI